MSEIKKPVRILVVDDEERNRRLLVAMLEAERYSSAEAADGMQALEHARQSPPDIVLLDVMIISVGDGRTLPSHFDPAVLEAFKGCVGRCGDVFEAHHDDA
jgi:CheY-like chemotaxis protein